MLRPRDRVGMDLDRPLVTAVAGAAWLAIAVGFLALDRLQYGGLAAIVGVLFLGRALWDASPA
jgi:hypothetical protein